LVGRVAGHPVLLIGGPEPSGHAVDHAPAPLNAF